MTKILALDTATDACSVALQIDGRTIEETRIIPRQHTQQLMPMVQQILAEGGVKVTDLDAIAFGRGPGSFAGIRIATGVAQGLAFAADLPVVPVSTLAAMALRAGLKKRSIPRVIAALDARMNEIYWGAYEIEAGLPILLGEEHVSAPEDLLPEESGQYQAVGRGFIYLDDMDPSIPACITEPQIEVYPEAGAMLPIALAEFNAGRAVSAELAQPVYLREGSWKKKHEQ